MARVVVREDIKPLYRGAGRLIRAGEWGTEVERHRPDHNQYASGSRSVVRFDADPADLHNVPTKMLAFQPEEADR